MLHVELMKKVESSDNNDKDCLEVEGDGGYNVENDGNIRDEYFDVNMEPPRVHDVASAPGHEGDVLDVPTLEERPNQETTASAPTPKRQRPGFLDRPGLTGQASPEKQRAKLLVGQAGPIWTGLTSPGQVGLENQRALVCSLVRTEFSGPA
ncbi:hypothetical protein TIFTF001_017341 [Ficus carica]|uniref:Uncharacterized protein n=1 Tax=Ficus carica TaxID=3494 RepID=A0AA88D9K6_FICCA|nr:hypothetical protein TIFTF001_017341 [Ficus carica]